MALYTSLPLPGVLMELNDKSVEMSHVPER